MTYDPSTPSTKKQDWAGLILVGLALVWIWIITLAIHWIAWTAEQFTIVQATYWPNWVWPLIALAQSILLLLPLGPLAIFWRGKRYRAVFRTWGAAALFVLVLVPARLAPFNQEQLFAILRCLCTAVYCAAIGIGLWQTGTSWRPSGSVLPVLFLVPLVSYAWLAWGALGSFLDTLLNVVSALLFGLGAGLTVAGLLLDDLEETETRPGWNLVLGALAASTALLMMASAMGTNGLQLFLMLTLPALGVLLPGFARWGRSQMAAGWLSIAILIGLSTAVPLLFVDPDELLLVLNLGSRDVMAWVIYASLVSIAVSLILSLVLFLARHKLPVWTKRVSFAIGTVFTWVAGILVFVLAGQPGWYGDSVFVILSDQADVSLASQIDSYEQRRQTVYDTLVNHAKETQQDLRTSLDRLRIDYTPYYLVNAIEVDAGLLLRAWLNLQPSVDRVLHNPELRPLPAPPPTARGLAQAPTEPQWNLTTIGADRVWREFGVRGEGILVGQSDSGAQWTHPELYPTYRGKRDDHNYTWFDPWNHTEEPTDIGGHGTHTLGSVLGQSVGVAPAAEWYACVNLARNLANPARYLDCMQFMLAPFPLDGDPFQDGDPIRGAHVINNSWGCPEVEGCDPTSLAPAVRALRAAGVFVVASAGNEGPACSSVSSPIALYDESFSVGASDSQERIAFFSSRGPVTADGSNRTKPDILAPGENVLSAYPQDTYYYASGTSMAGPHVVGIVALIWSANPNLIGDIDKTEEILIETARPYDFDMHGLPPCSDPSAYPDNAVGYGLVDAHAAVERALELIDSP